MKSRKPHDAIVRQRGVIQFKPSLAIFHGFGHIIHANQTQDKVIDFENIAIEAYNQTNGTNIPLRKPDTHHNKLEN